MLGLGAILPSRAKTARSSGSPGPDELKRRLHACVGSGIPPGFRAEKQVGGQDFLLAGLSRTNSDTGPEPRRNAGGDERRWYTTEGWLTGIVVGLIFRTHGKRRPGL